MTSSTRAVTERMSTGPMARRLIAGGMSAGVMGGLARGQRGGGRCLCLHLADEGLYARLRQAGEGPRVDADPHDEEENGDQHQPLAQGQVGEAAILLARDLSEDYPLVHPEHVDRGKDDAGG